MYFYFFTKKNWFSVIFSTFYGQRSVGRWKATHWKKEKIQKERNYVLLVQAASVGVRLAVIFTDFWSRRLPWKRTWPLFSLTFFFCSSSAHCFSPTSGIVRKLKFCLPWYFGITRRRAWPPPPAPQCPSPWTCKTRMKRQKFNQKFKNHRK